MEDVEIVLIADKTDETDRDGYPIKTETEKTVFARKKSVARTEFYEALRSGMNPVYIFEMFAGDYDGQRLVEYEGVRYEVARSFQTSPDCISLTCKEVRRK